MPRIALRLLPAAAFAAVLLSLLVEPALAGDPPVPNKGDTAWMMVATVMVLLMTIPGLALFYAGLVRAKNVVSMLLQVFAIVCLVAVLWVLYGYSLAFTGGGPLNDYVGGLSKAFLMGVTAESNTGTFSNGVVIPELVFVCFQMTFACLTPALIGSVVIFKVVDLVIGARVSPEAEQTGLDLSQHGERGYAYEH